MAKIYPQYNGRLGDKDALYEYLTKYQKAEIAISKLAHYLNNMFNVDSSDANILALNQKFDTLYTKIKQSTAFFMPQMYSLSNKYLESLLSDKKFANFSKFEREF